MCAACGAQPAASVSCVSPKFCMESDGDKGVYRFDGHAGANVNPAFADVGAVSCASTLQCIGLTSGSDGSSGLADQYTQGTWAASATQVANSNGFSAVSCSSTSFCAGVGSAGGATTWDGSGWTAQPNVTGDSYLDAVSCTESSFCQAVGANGAGGTWNGSQWIANAALGAGSKTTLAVSCASFNVLLSRRR